MLVRLLFAFVPYVTVGLGMVVFKNAWVAILSYHVVMILAVFLSKSTIPKSQVIAGENHGLIIVTAVTGAFSGVLLYLLWPLFSVPVDISVYLDSIGLTAVSWPYFIAYYVLVNPVLEEYYWRGFLGSDAKWPVPNDFLFAGYHLIVLGGQVDILWLVVMFVVLGGAAWCWRQISRITKGLLAVTLSHMTADVTIILVIYFMTKMG